MTKYLNNISWWCLSLLMLLSQASNAQEITANTIDEASLIGNEALYFESDSKQDNYKVVMSKLAQFKGTEKQVFSTPAQNAPVWVYFEVSNSFDEDLWIDVHNSNLTIITLYRFDENQVLIDSFSTGASSSSLPRQVNMNTFLFKLADADETEELHFLIRTETYLANELPLFFGSFQAVQGNAIKDKFMALFFIGSLTILFLYNLFFFLYLRRRIYLFYSLNCLAFLLVGPYFNNFPILEYVFNPDIAHEYAFLWTNLTLLTGALFTLDYLKLKKNAPSFRKYLITFVIIYFALTPCAIIWPDSVVVRIYILLTISFYLSCLGIGLYLLIKKNTRGAVLYCVGWSALVIGILIMVLVRNGVIPYNFFTRNTSYYGAFIEALAFAIGVGRYINFMRLEQIKLNKELVVSNQELRASNDSLDSFNYHVSHDLKTVLNNSKALTKMISKYNAKGNVAKVTEVAQKLEKVTENGVETVQSFLSLGKIDSLFKQEIKEHLSIEKEIYGILERHHIKDKIDVQILRKEVEGIKIHEKAFESVFLNLFTNTIKYSGDLKKAELQFYKTSKNVLLIYKDFGKGIDMDKYGDTLFKPFERGGALADTEGTGVGLYVVNRIILNYGGAIKIDSSVGEGVRVEIKLPLELAE